MKAKTDNMPQRVEQEQWAAPSSLLWVAAAMLLVAVGSWSYDFYKAVRWVTFLAFAWSAFIAWHARFKNRAFLFAAIAVLFNPLAPFHFDKGIWQVLDAITAAIAAAVAWLNRIKNPTDWQKESSKGLIVTAGALAGIILGAFAGIGVSSLLHLGKQLSLLVMMASTIGGYYAAGFFMWKIYRSHGDG